MKDFLDADFMLSNETAKRLYHNYAKSMPIFDYHSHLSPKEILENKPYKNLYEIWLTGDHYKWRAMRSFGISEEFVTGNASPIEKFKAFAKMIPYTIGNPLFHWTHLELQRYFDISEILSEESAERIWNITEKLLAEKNLGPRELLSLSNVTALCTTDDPIDSLEYHTAISKDNSFKTKVLPTFRPDKVINFQNREKHLQYLKELGKVTSISINSYKKLLKAVKDRHDFFHSVGCRLSDHALGETIFERRNDNELEQLFSRYIAGENLLLAEVEALQTAVLLEIGKLNAEKNWVMQIHIGALRNNNTKMFNAIGADTGYDSIADKPIAEKLSRFLDALAQYDNLPKTILYVLNPSDNYTIGTMIGNFQDGNTAGKVQFGSGWWFNDQRDGMEAQMKTLANLGLLSQFVGMLTDSRSFLSFPRHEYFRRILCNMLGTWVENGEYPNEESILGEIIQNIAYNNAKNYIKID